MADRNDAELRRLGAATAALEPDAGFTDALLARVASRAINVSAATAGDPLAEAAGATEVLAPTRGFDDALFARIAARAPAPAKPPRLADGLVRSGPYAVLLACAAAAACALFAVDAATSLDADIVTSVDLLEVAE